MAGRVTNNWRSTTGIYAPHAAHQVAGFRSTNKKAPPRFNRARCRFGPACAVQHSSRSLGMQLITVVLCKPISSRKAPCAGGSGLLVVAFPDTHRAIALSSIVPTHGHAIKPGPAPVTAAGLASHSTGRPFPLRFAKFENGRAYGR